MIKFPFKILEPVRRYLKREEKKLVKRKKDLEKEDPFKDSNRVNDNAPDTDVDEQVSHARVTALLAEINKNLIRIRQALTRIKIGKYGLCKDCAKMINTERLAVDPAVERCLKCEKKRSE